MSIFKQVCGEINMPIAPDKSEGPATVIKFLGLTLDTSLMVIRVPSDKLQDISYHYENDKVQESDNLGAAIPGRKIELHN